MKRVNTIQGWINHEISSGQRQRRRGVRDVTELGGESLFHKMLGEIGLLDGAGEARRLLHVNTLKELASRKRGKILKGQCALGWFGGFVL